MKLKVCKWIDSNIWGGLLLIDGEHCFACCIKPNFNIFDDNRRIKFKDINVIELQEARKKLLKDLNNDIRHECDNCEFLVEKEEEDINVGPLSYLSIANFKTCNLRCKYCYYTHEELGEKLLEDDAYILPILKNFYNNGAIKKDGFCLAVAGGEPLLIKDLVECVNFMSENMTNSILNLQSNSTITSRVKEIVYGLKNTDGVYKFLYTSIDAGTEENYTKIRGNNLYKNLIENLVMYAENSIFNEIDLKYILLEDDEQKINNLSEEDVIGFCNIVKLIKIKNKNKTIVTLDKDLRTNGNEISDKMLEAAGKIYYICKELLKVDVNFIGGGLVENSKVEIENIEKIKVYSNFDKSKYIYMFDLEKISKRINNIDRIAWWIPIRKWRDSFRNKMLNKDQTRPDQTRPDLICKDYIYTNKNNIIIITNKLQLMLQDKIAA